MANKRRFSIGVSSGNEGIPVCTALDNRFYCILCLSLDTTFVYSISDVKITAKARVIKPVGFDNYVYIFTKDIYFVERLRFFFINILFSLPIILVFSLTIAMLINQKIKLQGFFRTLFFLPVIIVSGPVLNRLIDEGATTIPLIEQYGIYAN